MSCDECGKDSGGGSRKEFIAGVLISQQTYDTGTAIMGRSTYTGFTPVEVHLCDDCLEPRARRASRVWKLSLLGFVAGAIALLFISYNIWFWTFFIPGNQVPNLPAWRIVVGLLSGLVALPLLKLAWDQIQPGLMQWRADSAATTDAVLYPYAVAKAKAAGKDTVWNLETYKLLQRTL